MILLTDHGVVGERRRRRSSDVSGTIYHVHGGDHQTSSTWETVSFRDETFFFSFVLNSVCALFFLSKMFGLGLGLELGLGLGLGSSLGVPGVVWCATWDHDMPTKDGMNEPFFLRPRPRRDKGPL